MTPREADVVYALESLACVAAVYGVERRAGVVDDGYDFVVEIRDRSARDIAAVHYRVLSVLSHEDAGRVLIQAVDALSKPRLLARFNALALTEPERAAARRRAAERTPVETRTTPATQPTVPSGIAPPRVLVFDAEPQTIAPALTELTANVRFVHDVREAVANRLTFEEAAALIRAGEVDLVLCESAVRGTDAWRLCEAAEAFFENSAPEHFLLITSVAPPPELDPFLKVTKPLDVGLIERLAWNATAWRASGRER